MKCPNCKNEMVNEDSHIYVCEQCGSKVVLEN